MNTYIDEAGRTWHKFALEYVHPVDDMQFSVDLWAIDDADAEERLAYLKENGEVVGRVIGEVK